jgi:hypothetical protein
MTTNLFGKIVFSLNCSLLLVFAEYAKAAPCKEGEPLLKLVNHADAVAIVEVSPSLILGRVSKKSRVRVQAEFRQMLKPPLRGSIAGASGNTLILESPNLRRFSKARQYVMFLRQSSAEWFVPSCHYLEITADGNVPEACGAVSDLFSDNPYERERRCLLSYPASVSLPSLRKEIERITALNDHFSGSGRFAEDARWEPDKEYQEVLVELDHEARKEFFATRRFPRSFPIKMHISRTQLSEEKFARHIRRGVRVQLSGTWDRGSFVVESFDWLSGRRPKGKKEIGKTLWF